MAVDQLFESCLQAVVVLWTRWSQLDEAMRQRLKEGTISLPYDIRKRVISQLIAKHALRPEATPGWDFCQASILNLDECCDLASAHIRALITPAAAETITELHFSGLWQLDDATLEHLLKSTPQLCALDISRCNHLTSLPRAASVQFKRIKASHCTSLQNFELFEHCATLTHANFSGCWRLTGDHLKQMISRCNGSLRLVHLAGCVLLDPSSLQALASCTSLVDLDLENCGVTDEVLLHFENSALLALNRLNLSNNPMLLVAENSGLVGFISSCLHLKSLSMACLSTADDSLSTCFQIHRPSLEHLDLSGCADLTNFDLQQIVQHCPNLKFLSLLKCGAISDGGLILLESLTKLEDLRLSHEKGAPWGAAQPSSGFLRGRISRPRGRDLWRISDDSLITVFHHLHNLKVLDLGRTSITNGSLFAVAAASTKLAHLALVCNSRVSDASMYQFADQAQLTRLDVRGCPDISDFSQEYLLRRCKNMCSAALNRSAGSMSLAALTSFCRLSLVSLDVTGIQSVSDKVVQQIAITCPLLKSFTLKDCKLVTDAAFTHPLPSGGFGFSSLTKLDISECRKITSSTITHLRGACPHLSIFYICGCVNILASALMLFGEAMQQLTTIGLVDCVQFVDDDIARFLRSSSAHLELLLLDNVPVGRETLKALVECCPHVRRLSLSGDYVRREERRKLINFLSKHFTDVSSLFENEVSVLPMLQSLELSVMHPQRYQRRLRANGQTPM